MNLFAITLIEALSIAQLTKIPLCIFSSYESLVNCAISVLGIVLIFLEKK
jgi:hypothetical protein